MRAFIALDKNKKFLGAARSKKAAQNLFYASEVHEIAAQAILNLCDLYPEEPWEKEAREAEQAFRDKYDRDIEEVTEEEIAWGCLESWGVDPTKVSKESAPKAIAILQDLELAGCLAIPIEDLPSWDVLWYLEDPARQAHLRATVYEHSKIFEKEMENREIVDLPF